MLSKKGSINQFKGIQNYIWRTIKNNKSLLLSTFSEGTIYNAEHKTLKNYKAIVYIFDNDAEIVYPNGQKETIIERLIHKNSQ